ncbi:MAG TPA: SUMF1/EgtB/PvdO family nonheme iron enzyme [Solirubrobacteraceae bacterium]|nr:SUMF1/EgtB/PvdO family nonheme iron enzyme [Solirubrobacteraceae bacterium]HUB75290.1 SUMF1/EgtB/PvdO family nonheme iron enzyme [Solirubrobacteraceae bacterium]
MTSESRLLTDKLADGDTTSSMQIVVMDIFGYASRRAHAQLTAMLAMTACFRAAIDATGAPYAAKLAKLNAHIQNDSVMLPTGTGLAVAFPFGVPGVSMDFVDNLLRIVARHNAELGACAVFDAGCWCDCHPLLLPCIGVSEGPTVLYRDVNNMINVAGDTVIAAISVAALAEPAQVFLTDTAHRTVLEYVPGRSGQFRPYFRVELTTGAHENVHQYANANADGLNTHPAAGLGVMEEELAPDAADATAVVEQAGDEAEAVRTAVSTDLRCVRDLVAVGEATFDAGPRNAPSASLAITRPFLIGATLVTQADYELVTGRSPSRFPTADHPVESVSWFDAVQFCNALSALEQRKAVYEISGSDVVADPTRDGYRLPSEAEWELCCRTGDGSDQPYGPLDSVAWYGRNAEGSTHPVAALDHNRGVFDLLGNVWEWCGDWFQPGYPPDTLTNYTGPPEGFQRVLRGGSWRDLPDCVTPTYRHHAVPSKRESTIGFRIVRSVTHPIGA